MVLFFELMELTMIKQLVMKKLVAGQVVVAQEGSLEQKG